MTPSFNKPHSNNPHRLRSPSPQLSPLFTYQAFSRSRSLNRLFVNSLEQPHSLPQHSKPRQRAKPASADNESEEHLEVALCFAEPEELPEDFQLHRALKPLSDFKTIDGKRIFNPYLFRGAPMVTTFIRSAGSRTKGVLRFLEKASRLYIRVAEK